MRLQSHTDIERLTSDMEKSKPDSYSFDSAARGYHVYRRIWNARIGEQLQSTREDGNSEDKFAIALTKDDVTIGHVPREQSRILWHFLSHGGKLTAEVSGRRRRSPLLQGGLEIPCSFTVEGPSRLVQGVRELIR